MAPAAPGLGRWNYKRRCEDRIVIIVVVTAVVLMLAVVAAILRGR